MHDRAASPALAGRSDTLWGTTASRDATAGRAATISSAMLSWKAVIAAAPSNVSRTTCPRVGSCRSSLTSVPVSVMTSGARRLLASARPRGPAR